MPALRLRLKLNLCVAAVKLIMSCIEMDFKKSNPLHLARAACSRVIGFKTVGLTLSIGAAL